MMGTHLKFHLILWLLTVIIIRFTSAKLEITSNELRALETFRPLVEDILTHDYQRSDSYLIGWLRAKKLNVKEAVQMLKVGQKWRKENQIDTILSETFQDIPFVYGDDALDYEGRTVLTKDLNNFDLRQVVLNGKADRYIRFTQYAIEKVVSRSAEAVYRSNGTLADHRIVSINDFKGFSFSKHGCLTCFGLFARNAMDLENYYPGVIGHEIFINTSPLAYPLFLSMRPFLSEETWRKIVIIGSDRGEWSNYIQGIVPPDQLTYQFGGNRTQYS